MHFVQELFHHCDAFYKFKSYAWENGNLVLIFIWRRLFTCSLFLMVMGMVAHLTCSEKFGCCKTFRISIFTDSIKHYTVFLCIWDHHGYTNMNKKDHLGQLINSQSHWKVAKCDRVLILVSCKYSLAQLFEDQKGVGSVVPKGCEGKPNEKPKGPSKFSYLRKRNWSHVSNVCMGSIWPLWRNDM